MLLDRALDSAPAFTVAGVGVGIAGAVVGSWVRIRSALRG
jgi:hypothetical protein